MRCKTCDYRLWNLSSRHCPECGSQFSPSEHDFVPNSVSFHCPHCDQVYYGIGRRGHLKPYEFDCVGCDSHINMDQMVLRPRADLGEDQTVADRNPWLDRKKVGKFKAWFIMLGRAMGAPGRLMKSTPEQSSTVQAFWYACVTLAIVCAPTLLAYFAVIILVALNMGGGGSMGPMLAVTGSMAGGSLVMLGVLMGFVVIWGLVTHGVLRISGGSAGGIGRTYQALFYSCGTNIIAVVPCLNFYVFWAGWIWWTVSAILMVSAGQKVHGGRSALAVLTLPVLTFLGLIGAIAFAISASAGAAGTGAVGMGALPPGLSPKAPTTRIVAALISHAELNSGRGPLHAFELVQTSGVSVSGSDFVGFGTNTTESDVPIGNTDLNTIELSTNTNFGKAAQQAAIAAQPGNLIAHRMGDYVFTYHGIDFNRTDLDPNLWIVIWSPDPAVNLVGSIAFPSVWVGQADGTVVLIPSAQFAADLAKQNNLRANAGLPPLMDPSKVLHIQPFNP